MTTTPAAGTLSGRWPLEPIGPAGAFVLTDAEVAHLGGGKRAAVVVTVGERSLPLRLGVMGGRNLLGFSKAARASLELELGADVEATITLDEGPREVVVPDELVAALASDPAAAAAYERLAPSHRKEYATWVGEAKQAATRQRRAEQALVRLTSPTG